MDLVRRAFSYLLLTSVVLSCTTVNNNTSILPYYIEIPINNKIEVVIDSKVDNKNIELITDNNIINVTQGSISTITLDKSDLWIGKLGGALLRYNMYTGETTSFLEDNYTIIDFSIKKILTTKTDIFVLQTNRVIKIRKSDDFIKIIQLPPDIERTSDMVIKNSKIIISTLGYGLWEYNINRDIFNALPPNINYISSLLIKDDLLYIGSMDNGLYEYQINNKKITSRISYPLQLFNKNIVKLAFKNNQLWIGTATQGLIKWHIENNSIDRLYPKEGVSFIFLDKNISVVSFIGFGVNIEVNNKIYFETIESILITNNVTSTASFENYLITGNIKKGLIIQETNNLK
ncbi:MAG: hypothetical protein OCD02_10000 [Spirochaetaceae bacterium]